MKVRDSSHNCGFLIEMEKGFPRKIQNERRKDLFRGTRSAAEFREFPTS